MKNYDIWSSSSSGNNTIDTVNGNTQNTLQSNIDFKSNLHLGKSKRKSKGVHVYYSKQFCDKKKKFEVTTTIIIKNNSVSFTLQ